MTNVTAMKVARAGPDDNAAILRRAYEAFNTADIVTLTKLFDANASWHTPGRSSIAGDRKGAKRSLPSSAAMAARRPAPSGRAC